MSHISGILLNAVTAQLIESNDTLGVSVLQSVIVNGYQLLFNRPGATGREPAPPWGFYAMMFF